jgi:hypothetical protein
MIESYLSDRHVIMKIGNTLVTKKLSKGTPQGSALGPGLWTILYDELLQMNKPYNSDIIVFCDDTLCLIWGYTIQDIELRTNALLKQISEWGEKVKLEFNPSKSAAILITRKQNFTEPKIIMNRIEIKLEKSIKYLGVIIDNKLNFNQHIQYIYDKTLKTIVKIPTIARNC